MIITIDGPAGAGKSTAAKALAARLGYTFLDTGAMYRAVAYAALRGGHDWKRAADLPQIARELSIELRPPQVFLDDEDVSQAIRTFEITSLTHYAADNPGVRDHLVQLQREAARDLDVVTEGRDQGTVVFPDAQCKMFLTATAEERARRRLEDLRARGENIAFDEVLAKQNLRDECDRSRDCGPLKMAGDAIEFVTDGLSPDEVVDRLETIVRQKMRE